jgi:hypothetical protein
MTSMTSDGKANAEVQGSIDKGNWILDQQKANVAELKKFRDKLSSIKGPSELAEIQQKI